jgi:hypothetical protein
MHLKAHKQHWYSTSAHNVLGSMNKSAVLCTLMYEGRSLNNENTNLFLASVDQNHFYFNSPSMYSYPLGMQKSRNKGVGYGTDRQPQCKVVASCVILKERGVLIFMYTPITLNLRLYRAHLLPATSCWNIFRAIIRVYPGFNSDDNVR